MSELTTPQNVLFIALRHAQPVPRNIIYDDPELSDGADDAIREIVANSLIPGMLGRYVVITSSGAKRTLQTAQKIQAGIAASRLAVVVQDEIEINTCIDEGATSKDYWQLIYSDVKYRLALNALKGAANRPSVTPNGGSVVVVSHAPTLAVIKGIELPNEPPFSNEAYLEEFSFTTHPKY